MTDVWVYPTADPYVTSGFAPSRVHPVTGQPKPHTGTDYRARLGTPLYAAHAGVVVRSTYDAATAGNYVRVDVGGGVWIGYSHLSRRDVRVGQRVTAGEVIGLAGATGSATASHLHFEVSVNGTKVDPVPFLAARVGTTAPGPPTTSPDVPIQPEEEPDMFFMQTTAENQWAVYAIVPGKPAQHISEQAWALYVRMGFTLVPNGPYLHAEVDLIAQSLGG